MMDLFFRELFCPDTHSIIENETGSRKEKRKTSGLFDNGFQSVYNRFNLTPGKTARSYDLAGDRRKTTAY
jgi:hypothetical protein